MLVVEAIPFKTFREKISIVNKYYKKRRAKVIEILDGIDNGGIVYIERKEKRRRGLI